MDYSRTASNGHRWLGAVVIMVMVAFVTGMLRYSPRLHEFRIDAYAGFLEFAGLLFLSRLAVDALIAALRRPS